MHENDAQVIISIMRGMRPSKPESSSIDGKGLELLWECCNACWNYDPVDRPSMAGVREAVKFKVRLEFVGILSVDAD